MNQTSYPNPYMPFVPVNQNYYSGTNNPNNDLNIRIERLERQLKRLESRIFKLEEENKQELNSLSKEYIKDDDGLYMV